MTNLIKFIMLPSQLLPPRQLFLPPLVESTIGHFAAPIITQPESYFFTKSKSFNSLTNSLYIMITIFQKLPEFNE